MSLDFLSERLTDCSSLLQGEVVYADYPVYTNIGDVLIWKGAQALLRRQGVRVIGQFGQRIGFRAHRLMKKCATICLQGGGNLGDLYPAHQRLRENLIQRYPDKRIVLFPQSIFYRNIDHFERFRTLALQHRDIHLCVRDQESFDLLRQSDFSNVHLVPDTAHALWPVSSRVEIKKGSVLYLLRKDIEAASLPERVRVQQSIDWEDIVVAKLRFCCAAGSRVDQIGGRILGNYAPAYMMWDWVGDMLMRVAVDLFSPYETIVTNRLHAMILAVLMKKKCIVYDNSYKKLSRYYAAWLKDIPGIEFGAAEE